MSYVTVQPLPQCSSFSQAIRRVKAALLRLCFPCLPWLLLPGTLCGSQKESLLIGPGDQLRIQVVDTPEMEQHPRVTDAGEIPVQGIGNVRVSGLTPAQAAEAIRTALIETSYMRHPQVIVNVEQYATQSVSVIGEVRNPGAYPINTPRSVLDVLALSGGLTASADRDITIRHRSDPTNLVHFRYSNDSHQLAENAPILHPGDTIIVSRAGLVYVLGDVNRPGGYLISANDSKITVLQAIAMAGGTAKSAKQGKARLLRRHDASIIELPVSIDRLEAGKQDDPEMLPNDILYVPFSYGKNLAVFGSSGVVAAASSAAVYAIP